VGSVTALVIKDRNTDWAARLALGGESEIDTLSLASATNGCMV
jgi:hypothetical protein